jgi:hypothetical protein
MKNVLSFSMPWASADSFKRSVKKNVFKTIIYCGLVYAFIMTAFPFVTVLNFETIPGLVFFTYQPSWLPFKFFSITDPVAKLLVLVFAGNYLRNVLFSHSFDLFKYLKWENMFYTNRQGESKSARNFELTANQVAHFFSGAIVSIGSGILYYIVFLNVPINQLHGFQLASVLLAVIFCNGVLIEKINEKLKQF